MSAPDEPFAPAYPSMHEIAALRPYIARVLWSCGVAARDIDDTLQDVYLGAWRAVQDGRFRPDPAIGVAESLKSWLRGIAWRQARHCTDKAFRRRELLCDEPFAHADVEGPDPHDHLDAREALGAMADLPLHHLDVLVCVTDPESVAGYAEAHRVSVYTAYTRLRIARDALAELIGRRS